MNWQPIGTAPRDGTRVLLVCAKPSAEMPKKKNFMAVDYWHNRETDPHAGFTGWGKFNTRFWDATHWMPLPEPPQ